MTKVLTFTQGNLREELTEQGHVLTGRLRDSIQYRIQATPGKVVGMIEAEDYALSMEFGVPASRIPFSGATGRGGTSKYISGLIRFFILRGRSPAEAKRAAFATANAHKREGMPTRGSYQFSKNGRRTGFVSHTINSTLSEIEAMFEKEFGAVLLLEFELEQQAFEPIRIRI